MPVDEVVANGVSYFSAAGNSSNASYQDTFRPTIDPFFGDITQDFDPGPGVDNKQAFTLQPGQSITVNFQWDQPFGSLNAAKACQNDIDIYVLDAAGTSRIGGSESNNLLGGDPWEFFTFKNTTGAT